jgi:type III secretion protein Q
MNALALRRVDSQRAQASRALGAGQRLLFEVQGQHGELLLRPHSPAMTPPATGVWFNCAAGPLCLSDAEALLSLLGELPLTLGREQHAWYWQFFNQRLSPVIADLLAPIELLEPPAPKNNMLCRIRASLGQETVHADLYSPAETLLALLRAATWQALQHPLDDSLELNPAVLLGSLSLTLGQLASLRTGDVLLPSHCQFDNGGRGQLKLAGRTWTAHAKACGAQVFLQLGHEEYADHAH